MLALPSLTPVMFGCTAGVLWPGDMVTVVGVTVSFVVSVLANVTVTVVEAGAGKVTLKGTDWPNPTEGLAGRPIGPAVTTVMDAVALGRFGAAVLAVMVVIPSAFAVIGTLTLVAPPMNETLTGTVATV